MEYSEYVGQTQRAAKLSEAGQYVEAVGVLAELVRSDISDIDKSMMCLNIAMVYDKLKREDLVIEWHDRGVTYERPHARAFVALHKAGYLATRGQVAASLDAYRALANLPFLTEGDKEAIRRNVATLGGAHSA